MKKKKYSIIPLDRPPEPPKPPKDDLVKVNDVSAILVTPFLHEEANPYILYTIDFWIHREESNSFRCVIALLVLKNYFGQFSQFIFPMELISHIISFLYRSLPENAEFFSLKKRFSKLSDIADTISECKQLTSPFPSKSWLPWSTTSDEEVKERIILLKRYFQEAVDCTELLLDTKFCLLITSNDKMLSNILQGIARNRKYKDEYQKSYTFYRNSVKYYSAQTFFNEPGALGYPEQMKFNVNKLSHSRALGCDELIGESTSKWAYFQLIDAKSPFYDFALTPTESPTTNLYFIKKEAAAIFQWPKYQIYRVNNSNPKSPKVERLLHVEIERNLLDADRASVFMNSEFNVPQISIEGSWPRIKIYQGNKLSLSTTELGEIISDRIEIVIPAYRDICFFLTLACLMKKLYPLRGHNSTSDGFCQVNLSLKF